jgi:hypothetical protein
MSKSLVPGVVQLNTDVKRLEWQSYLMSLSIKFTPQLHAGLGHPDDNLDMVEKINGIFLWVLLFCLRLLLDGITFAGRCNEFFFVGLMILLSCSWGCLCF